MSTCTDHHQRGPASGTRVRCPHRGVVNRYYDPSTGQFLSVDPDVAQTGQPYAYSTDNPTNWTDPLGLGPRPSRSCAEISAAIAAQVADIQQRYQDMVTDQRGEFGTNPPSLGTTAAGHLLAYSNAQRALKKLIDEWNQSPCGGNGVPVPYSAYRWAYQSAPRPAPSSAIIGPGAGGSSWSSSSAPSSEQYFSGSGLGFHVTPNEILGGGIITVIVVGGVILLSPAGI